MTTSLREHYLLMQNYRLKHARHSRNRSSSGLRLAGNMLRYLATRTGPLSNGSHDACAFIRSRPELDRPDCEILTAAWSLGPDGGLEDAPGMHLFAYHLRPESAGTIAISSADARQAPRICPRYLATENDRRAAIDSLRFIRRLVAMRPLADLIVAETRPGPAVQSDDEILDIGAWARSPTMPRGPAAWVKMRMRARCSTSACARAAWPACAWWTSPSCRRWYRATPTARPWPSAGAPQS
jgi:choline dehydrogenase-like flavoprotein